MNLDTLFTLFDAARRACGHTDYVVVGSLSILGMEEVAAIPAGMTISIDADCYTRADPGRIYDLAPSLGEGSPFHKQHNCYLDPVSPRLPTLPAGWEQRLVRVERHGIALWFLEPNDATISKLARGEPRDLRWVRAGLEAGLVSLPMVRLRMKETSFLDDDEKSATAHRLDALAPKRRGK